MGKTHIPMDWVDKSSELNLPRDGVSESSKGMILYFYQVFLQREVLFLQSHVMTYDLQTTTAYWWCENFGEGHEYLRPSVQTRSRLLPSSGIPVVARRQVATFAQSTSERAALLLLVGNAEHCAVLPTVLLPGRTNLHGNSSEPEPEI